MEIPFRNSSFALIDFSYYSNTTCYKLNLKLLHLCWMNVLWTVAEFLTFVVGLPAHARVFWVLKQAKERDPTSSFFIVNMTVIDLLAIVSFPIDFLNYYFWQSVTVNAYFKFIIMFNIVGSPLFLCVLCVERYVAVVWATKYAHFRSLKCRVGCCVVIWLIVMACSIEHLTSKAIFLNEDNIYVYFLIPAFSIMLFCSFSILKILGKSVAGVDKIHPIKVKASRTVSMILIFTLVVYVPPTFVLPFQHYYPHNIFHLYLMPLCLFFLTTSSFIHSVLYLYILGKLPLGCNLCKNQTDTLMNTLVS